MRCQDFRSAVLSGALSDEMLAHLRSCESCMNVAVESDGELMFRAIGGEIAPPGGAEAFAAEVMHQIHVRETERRVHRGFGAMPVLQRWAIAAAATFVVITGAMLWPRGEKVGVPVAVTPAVRQADVVRSTVRPVVERWDSPTAMIIEIPEEETSDLKVVMVFDESLPADI
jgi:hypothetical protein